MIYTSYFAKLKNIKEISSGEFQALSIARSQPPGFKLATAFCLRPWEFMISQYKDGLLTPEGYSMRYRECVLVNISPMGFTSIYPGDLVLVCWEKSTDFCHRHIVSEWLNAGGVECKEYGDYAPPKYSADKKIKQTREGDQISLF